VLRVEGVDPWISVIVIVPAYWLEYVQTISVEEPAGRI
jgi:hypothetical protein